MAVEDVQREKILERLRALLAMTTENGCTEAEAMTAAAKAAKLMTEYDLTFSDANKIKDERIATQSKPYAAHNNSRTMHAAGLYVAVAVATFFDCKVWRNGNEVVFFGLKDDVELAQAMLAMIRMAMDRELSSFLAEETTQGNVGYRQSLSSSFSKGMGLRISQRLDRLKAERTTSGKATGLSLIVLKGEVVTQEYTKLYGKIRFKPTKSQRPPSSEIAFVAGIEAAERVNLGHKELHGTSPHSGSGATAISTPLEPKSTKPSRERGNRPPQYRKLTRAEAFALIDNDRTSWMFSAGTLGLRIVYFGITCAYFAAYIAAFLALLLLIDKDWANIFDGHVGSIRMWLMRLSGPVAGAFFAYRLQRNNGLGQIGFSDCIQWRVSVRAFDKRWKAKDFQKVPLHASMVEHYLARFDQAPHWAKRFIVIVIFGAISLTAFALCRLGNELHDAMTLATWSERLAALSAAVEPQFAAVASEALLWSAGGYVLSAVVLKTAVPARRSREIEQGMRVFAVS